MSRFENEREFYIFGEPMETELGRVRFLTYKEYLLNIADLSMMNMNVLHIYYQYRKMFDEKDKAGLEALESLKKETLYDIVMQTQNILESYIKIYKLVFEEDDNIQKVFENEETFMWYRELVMDMQMMTEQLVNPNPEIQAGIDAKRELDSLEGGGITPTTLIASIVAGTANSFEDVCNMTAIQVNATFFSISSFKNYDTNILFASAGADIKNMGSWSENINLFKKEQQGIKKKDFDKKFGGLLG